MEIIAHRGFWKTDSEKNREEAFERGIQAQIGTETDFRDYEQKLVISHNVADSTCMSASDFFAMYKNQKCTLALNVKADGIQQLLKELLNKNNITNYFCFDMSIPDTLEYINADLKFFVRESEYEKINSLYEKAEGVWADGFESDVWITKDYIENHRNNGKRVCIVSSDLHKRDYSELWERINDKEILNDDGVILCTDYPDKAKEFFYGKD